MICNFSGKNCTFYLYGQTGSENPYFIRSNDMEGFLYYIFKNLTKNSTETKLFMFKNIFLSNIL